MPKYKKSSQNLRNATWMQQKVRVVTDDEKIIFYMVQAA